VSAARSAGIFFGLFRRQALPASRPYDSQFAAVVAAPFAADVAAPFASDSSDCSVGRAQRGIFFRHFLQ
jgi:hypothetical protein